MSKPFAFASGKSQETDEQYATILGGLLSKKKWQLAIAESCTGGLISHILTNIPGSSSYFLGGVVCYSNEVKINLLGVQEMTISLFGAVSRETAIEMVRGVRKIFHSNIALSVTGIAGPSGGTQEKPVGLTWIGISTPDIENGFCYHWDGDRLENKKRSARQALSLLIDALQEK